MEPRDTLVTQISLDTGGRLKRIINIEPNPNPGNGVIAEGILFLIYLFL